MSESKILIVVVSFLRDPKVSLERKEKLAHLELQDPLVQEDPLEMMVPKETQ